MIAGLKKLSNNKYHGRASTCILLALLLCTSSLLQAQSQAKSPLEQAIKLAQEADDSTYSVRLQAALEVAESTSDSVFIYYKVATKSPSLHEEERFQMLDQAIEMADSSDKNLSKIWYYKGYIYERKGDYLSAEKPYQEALFFYKKNKPGSIYISHSAKNLGNIYARFGDYDLAIYYLEKAIAGYHQKGKWERKAQAMADLAVSLWSFGQSQAAKDTAQRIFELEGISPLEKGLAHQILGEYWHEQQAWDSAISQFNEAIIYFQQFAFEPYKFEYLVETHTSLGNSLLAKGEIKAAFEAFARAKTFITLAYADLNCREVGKWHIAFGHALRQQHNWDQALFHFQQALYQVLPHHIDTTQLATHFSPDLIYQENVLMEALEGKAWVWKGKYEEDKQEKNLVSAIDALDLCYQVEDFFRSSFKFESSRLSLAEDRHRRVELSLWAICQLKQKESYFDQAFSYMERSKALSLLEELREDQYRQHYFPEDIQYTWRRLEQKIQILGNASMHSQNWRQAQLELANFLASLTQQFPDYYRFKYNNPIPNLKAVAKQLAKNQAILAYFWGEQNLYAFHIDKGNIQLLELGEQQSISTSFQQMLGSLQQTQHAQLKAPAYAAAAHHLWSYLIHPFGQLPDNILLIPDGDLARLPFDALVCEQQEEASRWRELSYWVNQKNVSYAWSYSLWQQVQSYEADRIVAVSPLAFQELAPLPRGEKIAGQLTDLYGSKFTALLAQEANKTQFWATVDQAQTPIQILHFHTHAQANPQNPAESWISLSDEKLYLQELYHRQLRASLAVLGACETADGQLQIGEGVMSFARAFTHAGCQSVIGTLWSTDEQATTALLMHFYEKIHSGTSKDLALTQSKRDFLAASSDRPSIAYHPRNWASLVLIGDQTALPLSSNFGRWGLIFVIFLAMGMLWVWQKN